MNHDGTNSHVAMERKVCIVTGKTYDTGAVLLATRYARPMTGSRSNPKPKPFQSLVDLDEDRYNISGWGVCDEVQKRLDEDYIALVGIDPEKSDQNGSTINPENAYRTGEIVYLRREAWEKLMNAEAPPKGVAFIDAEAIAKIMEIVGDNVTVV